MANVTIKNMPLNFLKKSGDGFFTTDTYLKAKEVFDKYKEPIESSNGESSEETILPLGLLKDMISARYFGYEVIPSTLTEREDTVFLYLVGKEGVSERFSPRKRITRTAREIRPPSEYFTRKSSINSLVNKAEGVKKNSVTDMDALATLLRPEKTDDVVLDIIAASKFYENIPGIQVYDDELFKELNVKRLSVLQSFILTSIPLPVKEKIITAQYVDNGKELSAMNKSVRDSILRRYYEVFQHKRNIMLWNERNDLYVRDIGQKERDRNLQRYIEITMSKEKDKFRLNCFKFTLLAESNSIVIDHTLQSDFIKPIMFNLNGLEITKHIADIEVLTSSSVKLTFDEPVQGTIFLLCDTIAPSDILNTPLPYYVNVMQSHNIFKKFDVTTYFTKATLFINNLDKDYLVVDCRHNGELIEYTALEVFNDRVEITFEDDHQDLIITILPLEEILRGSSSVPLNHNVIYEFLSEFKIFKDDFSIWKIANG